MHTLITASPEEAAAYIRRGEVAAFPTETVYGLGADAFNEAAVRKIYAAKGRPADNPLIVHIAGLEQLDRLVRELSDAARLLIDRFFPGPLTLVLPRAPDVPGIVSAGLDTVGIRMPRHEVARAFLEACCTPVAAPSANRSGRPSPTTWRAVEADLGDRIPCILRGDRSEIGLESTVVDCTGAEPLVLRAGAVSLEEIRAVLPQARTAGSDRRLLARSPGTRYRHYAPRARVRLVDRPEEAAAAGEDAYIGLAPPLQPDAFRRVRVCEDVPDYAYALYAFFRESDAAGVRTIYCQRVPPRDLGAALMDRLRRAAEE